MRGANVYLFCVIIIASYFSVIGWERLIRDDRSVAVIVATVAKAQLIMKIVKAVNILKFLENGRIINLNLEYYLLIYANCNSFRLTFV